MREGSFSTKQLYALLTELFDDIPTVTRSRYGWRGASVEGMVQGDVWIFVVVDARSLRGAVTVETMTCQFDGDVQLRELLVAVSQDLVLDVRYDPAGRPVNVILGSPSTKVFTFEDNDFYIPNTDPIRLWAAGLVTRGRKRRSGDGN